ncbi:hypothetical protein LBMAG21_07390 [Armatimonadota bacterium]|nr:hypothetical protein LBMAG21_07390 [Armatimonadota bacterium]
MKLKQKPPLASHKTLPSPSPQFFMSLRDLAFWYRSAKADSALSRLQREHGVQEGFDRLYSQSPDPWGYLVPHFRYQRLKYEKSMAMLPARRYSSVLDVGCGLGVFTRMVAPHCDSALGMELSSVAVEQAMRLSENVPNIAFAQGDILQIDSVLRDENAFDLILVADVLYYLALLSDEVLTTVTRSIVQRLPPGGLILLVNHYFFDLDSQSRTVRQIHNAMEASPSLQLVREQRHPFFLASLYEKCVEGENELQPK